MAAVDRVLAYRRPPPIGDRIGVLLWLLGWTLLAGAFVILGRVLQSTMQGPSPEDGAIARTIAVAVGCVVVLLWTGTLSWFVSEAYTTWRAGTPVGRNWALALGFAAVLIGLAQLIQTEPVDAWSFALAAFDSFAASTGLLLIVLGTLSPTGRPVPA